MTTLLQRVQAGELGAVARMISKVERGVVGVDEDLAELYRNGRGMRVVGVAGPPGAGKSTLVGSLARTLRAADHRVGILAVDPSSPLNGGALLGDRIRMMALCGDEGVFIRSMASRGCVGGLAHATADAVTILDAAGIDVTLVETVGVGQGEVEIADLAHTTVVVSVPGLGDDVQALKAGLLEMADVHVVNKADLPGAAATIADLKNMLRLAPTKQEWIPPVLEVVSSSGSGIDELVLTLHRHYRWMEESGELDRRLRANLAHRVRDLAQEMVSRRLAERTNGSRLPAAIDALVRRERDPYSVARELSQQDPQ